MEYDWMRKVDDTIEELKEAFMTLNERIEEIEERLGIETGSFEVRRERTMSEQETEIEEIERPFTKEEKEEVYQDVEFKPAKDRFR